MATQTPAVPTLPMATNSTATPAADVAQSIRSTTSSMHTASPTAADAETGISPDGYHRLSEFISQDFRHTASIFRRFDRLAIRNLLYIESELASLESRLDDLDKERSENMFDYLQDWPLLCQLADFGESEGEGVQEEAVQRRKLVLEIRAKLEEYHKNLKMTCEIFSLEMPETGDVLTNKRFIFQAWEMEKAKTSNPILQGDMLKHLDDKKDLCVLTPQVQRDALTKFVESRGMLRKLFHVDKDGFTFDLTGYRRLHKAVTVFSILLVVVWIVGAVISLYFWRNNNARLILLSVLTLSFAGTISFATNARRQDIYATTAAYAAVLVVFIGSALSADRTSNGSSGLNNPSAVANSTLTPRDLFPTRTVTASVLDQGLYTTQGFANDLTSSYLLHGMAGTACLFLCAFGLSALRRNGYRLKKIF